MRNPFNVMYDKYDLIREPYRFLILFIPMIFLCICAHSQVFWLSIFGCGTFFILFITRVIHLYGELILAIINKMKGNKK